MKPDFNIGARNGLLESKHYAALGNAIWLYLWFLDKQPKTTNKVLGGKPVTYEQFNASVDIPRRTYVRWLEAVEKGGYVDLLRTPRGYVVTINKPKKWVNSDVPKKTHHKASDVPKKTHHNEPSDVPKIVSDVHILAHAEDVHILAHPIKTIQSRHNNKLQTTTNVVVATPPKKVDKSKPEINAMFVYWHSTTGLQIHGRLQANRIACSNLIKKHGIGGVERLIQGVAKAQGQSYAPQIANFCDLQSKLDKLLVWGRAQSNNGGTIKV